MRKQKGKTAFKNRWGEKQPKSIRKKEVHLIDEQNNQKEESQFRQEKKQKERDGRDKLIVILLIITLLSVSVAVWAVISKGNSQLPLTTSAQTNENPEKLTDSIALPQFAWLTFTARTKKQTLTFTNPEQNFAQFRVSIVLDGETLWQSELLRPGETSEAVVLSRALSAGEYEARLVYECFTNDEAQNPLNGADSPVTLKVYDSK